MVLAFQDYFKMVSTIEDIYLGGIGLLKNCVKMVPNVSRSMREKHGIIDTANINIDSMK